MERIAIDLGFIKIYWYSITMFLGVLAGIIVAYIEIKRKKIDTEKFSNMAFYAILSGFIGARIYYVLFNLDYYLSSPIEILKIWNGGLAIHGGIIGAILAIYIYCRKNKFSFYEMLDICAPALIIGQIIGRWGNFFNSEAHGGIVTRGFLESLHLPKFIIDGMYIDGNYYHPTFLYESLLNLICFIILIILRRNKKIKTGVITGIYLMWYGVVRFFVESLRTDSLMLGSLRMAQVISIVLFIIGLVLIIISSKKERYNS
jgi:phosphatidylglycerol:prolipoprotein diacylglycerol transferase